MKGALFEESAKPYLQEQNDTVRYVTEEVARLKDMFHEREAQLASERDKANASCQEASTHCQEMEKALQDTTTRLASLASEAEVKLSSSFYISQTQCLMNLALPCV